jgi:hypothetical protein
MIAFIKNYEIESMKKKFILLYLLNVSDIIFTLLLLQTGYFSELNIFMVKAVSNPLISLSIKIICPAALLIYIYHRMKAANLLQLKAANVAVNISLTIYTLVNISHLVWVSLLPYFMANY